MTEQTESSLKAAGWKLHRNADGAEYWHHKDSGRIALTEAQALVLLNNPAAHDAGGAYQVVEDALKEIANYPDANPISDAHYIARKRARAALAAIPALSQQWLPIETRPTDEESPFLVRVPGNDVCKALAIQVTNFEGRMYPDVMDGLIDWEDAVTNATGWMPLPAATTQTKK